MLSLGETAGSPRPSGPLAQTGDLPPVDEPSAECSAAGAPSAARTALPCAAKRLSRQDHHLVTTLIDADRYRLEDLADLFLARWGIETHLGHLKTTLGLDVLKRKTVNGVLKELMVFGYEPRVWKRRPKPYPLLTKPRHELRKALANKTHVD